MATNVSDLVLDEVAKQILAFLAETRADFSRMIPRVLTVVRERYVTDILLGPGGPGGAGVITFWEAVLEELLGPFQRLASRILTGPARTGLAIVLLYGADQLFPKVKRSRVMTEREAAVAMVHMIAAAGMASGSFTVKGTSWVGSAIALLERIGGTRSQFALLVGRGVGKFFGKALGKRIEAVGYLLLNSGLALGFSLSCFFMVIWLLNDGWETPKTFLLPQDNPRVWTSKRRRVREGDL